MDALKNRIQENIRNMQNELGDNYWKISAPDILFNKRLPELLEKYSSGRLLDAGAGNLLYRDFLFDYCSEYKSLDVIESPEIDYREDIQNMRLDSESYDTVFCRNVLEHVENPQMAMNEISRVLREGGKAIISVPHLAYLHNEPNDYYRFTKYGIQHLVDETNLEILEIIELGGYFSFMGYIFSTGFLGFTYHVPIISRLAYTLNYPLQKLAVFLDRITKNESILPLNYIFVVEKT